MTRLAWFRLATGYWLLATGFWLHAQILTLPSSSLQHRLISVTHHGRTRVRGSTLKRILIALPALALVATACGGSESIVGVASLDDSTTTTAPSDVAVGDEAVEVEEAALAFAECLRQEGLDVPDPEFDGEGGLNFSFGQEFRRGAAEDGAGAGPSEEFQAALEVCRELLEGLGQRFERPDITEIEDDLLAFAECMRENGVDMADPDLSGGAGGPGGAIFFDFDVSDPAVEAALEICQSELAFGRPGGPGGRNNNGGDN